MRSVLEPVKRHPLTAFFVLSYALTWPLIPLVSFSPLWGFPALFGPALAAMIVVVASGGRAGLRDLMGRMARWRVGARWYAVAVGLPVVLTLATSGLHFALGARTTSVEFGRLSVLDFVVFVLIIGEELGWRGYALPRLLVRRSALSASLVLGVLWGFWHLPTFFVAGTPQHALPFSAFLVLTVAYSVVFTWVYLHTRGSVLVATLLHGFINFSQGFFLGGIDPAREYWLLTTVYVVAALFLVAATGLNLSHRPRAPCEVSAAPGRS